MLPGVVVGVALTVGGLIVLRGGDASNHPQPAAVRPACGVSIVLFEADGPESKVIDAATGSHGYSHVAIDGCEVDDQGNPLLIDCRPGLGVARVPATLYEGRGRTRVWLPLADGRELFGCARGRVGLSYDMLGLVVPKTGPVGGLICSQLVFECLPARLRARVPPWPEHRPVAPNDLARGFGAVVGREDVVL